LFAGCIVVRIVTTVARIRGTFDEAAGLKPPVGFPQATSQTRHPDAAACRNQLEIGRLRDFSDTA